MMATTPRKTALGAEELERRSLGLGVIERRLLILIDGNRGVAELQAMMGKTEIGPLLDHLVEVGCVLWPGREGASAKAAAPTPAPSAADPAAAQAPTDLPERSSKEREMARNFMINTLLTFIGPYANPELMKRLQSAPDSATLRLLYPEWRSLMDAPRAAGKRINELDAELKKVL
jgi:hypothetical protein